MTTNDKSRLLPVGTELQGRYRIVRQLASGGFGNTYEVLNTRFNERWAMKEFFMKGISERDDDTSSVSVSSASQPQFEAQREKFNKEARRLRRLRHPGIVHVEDLFDENGTSYYVMDYIGGGSLAELVRQHGPLPESSVRELLPQLLDALEYVHAQQMWHLDLKPGNILLREDGTPVIIDFGASKQLGLSGGHSTSTAMTYTQGYAPSEQVDQNIDRIGPWTDLYALGATLYNLLTGNTPPLVSEIQEAEGNAFNFTKAVSGQMRSLILWMMNPNRRKRPQSVADVRNYLQGEGATHRHTTTAQNSDETRMPDRSQHTLATKPLWQRLSSTQKGIIGGVVLAILISIIAMWARGGRTNAGEALDTLAAEVDTLVEEVVDTLAEAVVDDMPFSSSIGNYRYTGAVDEYDQPDDASGKAAFADGRVYEGPFVHGVMQGSGAYFLMSNGDVFRGEFRDNRFHRGRYTVKEDGSYFEGTFKDGQPDQGSWYDKNGTKL